MNGVRDLTAGDANDGPITMGTTTGMITTVNVAPTVVPAVVPAVIVEAHGRAPLRPQRATQCDQRATQCDQRATQCDQQCRQSPQTSLPPMNNSSRPMPQRTPRSISSFVAGFKSAATKRINEIRNTPGRHVWQTRFYDRIIWDENGFYAIQRYIQENPKRIWAKMNPRNLP